MAVDDAFEVQMDQSLDVNAPGILLNDSEPDNEPLTAVLVRGPSSASSFQLNADGSFSYDPIAGFTGTDTFTYSASDGTNSSAAVTVTITVLPDPVACIELLRVPADNYDLIVQSTLENEIPAIRALAHAGDVAGAMARQSAAIAAIVREAASAVGATQLECANCETQLRASGNGEFIPSLTTACSVQLHRIGAIQARAVSQLENAIRRIKPSPAYTAQRDRYVREINLNSTRAELSFDGFCERYLTIIRRHNALGNTTAASGSADAARRVLQRTSEARVRRIQQLCDNFVARMSRRPGTHGLIAAVTTAANAAMAEVQLAEAEAMGEIEAARGA